MNNKYKNGFINLVCYSFFMISVVFAQIDTVALSYYPLQNGNFWQYQENIYDWLLPSWDIRYKTFLVTGDTILSDQQAYKVLNVTSSDLSGNIYRYHRYERIDSISGNVFFYQFQFQGYKIYLLDSLYSLVGDTCRSSRYDRHEVSDALQQTTLDSTEVDALLGVVRTIKMFSSYELTGGYMSYSLAKGIGLSESWYSYDMGNTACKLLYAKISGVEYGDSVTSMND